MPDGTNTDTQRWTKGLIAVAMGIGALLIAFALVALLWRDTTGLAALGAIASPIAAIVGAYFGVQAGATATKEAEDLKTKALVDVATLKGELSKEQNERLRPHLYLNSIS